MFFFCFNEFKSSLFLSFIFVFYFFIFFLKCEDVCIFSFDVCNSLIHRISPVLLTKNSSLALCTQCLLFAAVGGCCIKKLQEH